MKITKINPLNFSYNNQNLRTEIINNEPYFCLKDVCNILEIGNTSDVVKRLDEIGLDLIEVAFQKSKTKLYFINEPNLYRVIFRSDKPEAKQFQDWVFNDVLPNLRKNGVYGVTQLPKTDTLKLTDRSGDETSVFFENNRYFVRSNKRLYHWIDEKAIMLFKPADRIDYTGLYLIQEGSSYIMRHLYQNGERIRIIGSSYGDFETVEAESVNIVGIAEKALV